MPDRSESDPAERQEARDRWLRRVQGVSTVIAGAALLFGFLSSIGARLFPPLTAGGFWIVAALLAVAGLGGGLATVARAHAIDRRRWEVVEDLSLTSGEREYAHKEAERERRWAGVVFLTTPVAVGYWSAYQLPPEIDTGAPFSATAFLALLPLGAYVVGLVAANLAQHRAAPTA